MKAKLSPAITGARGKIGTVVAQMRKTGAALVIKSVPYLISGKDRSTAQQAQNTLYGEKVEVWRALTDLEKETWNLNGEKKGLSGWNLFFREFNFWLGLTGWSNKKIATIAGSTDGTLTDYQMKITVHKGAGTDSGENVYLGSNVRNDFGDVRFTKSDGTTELSYWMETFVSGNNAIFWIKIDSIPASPSTTDIWVQYTNPTATTTSNPNTTFLSYHGYATTNFFVAPVLNLPYIYEGKARNGDHGPIIGLSAISDFGGHTISMDFSEGTNVYPTTRSAAGTTQHLFDGQGWTPNTEYAFKIVAKTDSIDFYTQDKTTLTDTISTTIPNDTLGIFLIFAASGLIHYYSYARIYASVEPYIYIWS